MAIFFEAADMLYSRGTELWNRAMKEKDEKMKSRMFSQAADMFETAMEKGCIKPMAELGAAYLMGLGRKTDYSRGFHISLYAAQNGSGVAANNVGVCYEKGLGIPADQCEASHWYIYASEKGYSASYWLAAVRLAEGNGIEKNLKEARKWGRKAVAAGIVSQEQYDGMFTTVPEWMTPEKAFDIAYEADENNEIEEALVYYRYAAEAGNTAAMNNLALKYENGAGVCMDKEKAYELLSKAAKSNDYAKMNLARYYAKGMVVAKNDNKAKYLLIQVMESGLGRASELYKIFYPDEYEGVAARIKIAQGKAEAVDYYHAAALDYRTGDYGSALSNALKSYADGNNTDACILIADAYIRGNGIEQNFLNAYRWILIALSYGLPEETENIVTAGDYLLTLSCEKEFLPDTEKEYAAHTAFALLYYAALKGNDVAELKVATCYLNGIGCEDNSQTALRFLESSAAHGNAAASEILNSVNRQ